MNIKKSAEFDKINELCKSDPSKITDAGYSVAAYIRENITKDEYRVVFRTLVDVGNFELLHDLMSVVKVTKDFSHWYSLVKVLKNENRAEYLRWLTLNIMGDSGRPYINFWNIGTV